MTNRNEFTAAHGSPLSAQVLIEQDLALLIKNHNNLTLPPYEQTFSTPSLGHRKAAFDLLCTNAILPGFEDKPEALIPVHKLKTDDVKTILWMLENSNIFSEFEWLPSEGSHAPHLTIKDAQNTHRPSSVVAIITEQKNKLRDDAEKIKPVYIPPFNAVFPDRDVYLLLDHMQLHTIDLLEKALAKNGIPFAQKDTDQYGHVIAISDTNYENLNKLKEMKIAARTADNKAIEPQIGVMITYPKGNYPTINLLQGIGEVCIPVEGMSHTHIAALEARIIQTQLPFSKKNSPYFGPVFAFDEQYEANLEVFRDMLRAEFNTTNNREATPAQNPNLGTTGPA